MVEIEKLKTLLERSKAEAVAKRKKRMKVNNSAKDRIKATVSKAVKVFRASKELHKEKLFFSSNACDTSKQFIQDKVTACHPELDISFLDKDDLAEGLEETDATATPMDTSRSKAPPTTRT